MYLTTEQLIIVLLLAELTDHLPDEVKLECAAEIEEAWRLHEEIQNRPKEPS